MNASNLFGFGADLEKRAVWAKGHEIPGFPKDVWRRDDFGNVIRFSDHGDRSSKYGWEIDHVTPTAWGGLDVHANKRPLHCKLNASHGGILGSYARNLGLPR